MSRPGVEHGKDAGINFKPHVLVVLAPALNQYGPGQKYGSRLDISEFIQMIKLPI